MSGVLRVGMNEVDNKALCAAVGRLLNIEPEKVTVYYFGSERTASGVQRIAEAYHVLAIDVTGALDSLIFELLNYQNTRRLTIPLIMAVSKDDGNQFRILKGHEWVTEDIP